jgi:hypothetical protein
LYAKKNDSMSENEVTSSNSLQNLVTDVGDVSMESGKVSCQSNISTLNILYCAETTAGACYNCMSHSV